MSLLWTLGDDGGHAFTFTLWVEWSSEEELDRLYAALSENGNELMPIGNYAFSRKYWWISDRFGVSWQLNLT